MKRIYFATIVAVMALSACDQAAAPAVDAPNFGVTLWGIQSCTQAGCMACDLSPVFYEASCPEALAWCTGQIPCPGGLEPLFCEVGRDPPASACVAVDLPACASGAQAWCCDPGGTIVPGTFGCKEPADCPDAGCLAASCVGGACAYAPIQDGASCTLPGHPGATCSVGACVP